jgi:hypothetical protein
MTGTQFGGEPLQGVQLEVGVNCRQVGSFCPTILSENPTTKTTKTSKKQRQRDSLLDPHMGQRCARERLNPGAVEKRAHPQTLITLLNLLRFPTAPGLSRWPEAAHVWVQKRIPPSPE